MSRSYRTRARKKTNRHKNRHELTSSKRKEKNIDTKHDMLSSLFFEVNKLLPLLLLYAVELVARFIMRRNTHRLHR